MELVINASYVKKIFRRNNNPYQCRAQKIDYYMFNKITGFKGENAEKEFESFMKKAEGESWININEIITKRKPTKPLPPSRKPYKRNCESNYDSSSESESDDSSSKDEETNSIMDDLSLSEDDFEKFQDENFLKEIKLYEIDKEEKQKERKERKRKEEEKKKWR